MSKNNFITYLSMIPVVGNLGAFIFHLASAIANDRTLIGDAISARSSVLKKHGHEIIALDLARNLNRPESELAEELNRAACTGKKELLELILDSRDDWSQFSIQLAIQSSLYSKKTEIAELVLAKHSNFLHEIQVKYIINRCIDSSSPYLENNDYKLILLMLNTYPKIDENQISACLVHAADKENCLEILNLLVTKFPGVGSQYANLMLEKASKNNRVENVKFLLQKFPNLIPARLESLLVRATKNKNKVFLDWLLITYKEHVTTGFIGAILEETVHPSSFDSDPLALIAADLLNKYPALPAKDLEPLMSEAAMSNPTLFKFYLNKFNQLQPENLQKVLDRAHRFVKRNIISFIQEKFPGMHPANLY